MSETLIAALIGALVGGGFAVLGGVVAHFLNLREDRIKRERDKADKQQEELRRNLSLSSETETRAKAVRSSLRNWERDWERDMGERPFRQDEGYSGYSKWDDFWPDSDYSKPKDSESDREE
jgi:hypothetical protein